MYPINAYVMHRSEGVCVVEDVRTERFPGTTPKQYYILRPVYENTATTVFLPVDSEDARLRPLLTAEEIAALLEQAKTAGSLWIDSDRLRQEAFHRLLHEGDPATLLALMLELEEHRKTQTANGKKLRFFDEKTLQDVERLIRQEYAHVLQIDKDAVLAYIRRNLSEIA